MTSMKDILDAPFGDLPNLRARVADQDSGEAYYCDIMIAYWQSDKESHEALVRDTRFEILNLLARLRLGVRNTEIPRDLLDRAYKVMDKDDVSNLLSSELYFVAAMAKEVTGDYEQASRSYRKAAARFEQEGCMRKSLKALHNSVASSTCADPEKRLVYEYQELKEKALRIGEWGTAGTAAINLSREYQLMNVKRPALRLANEGIDILAKGAFGSYEYYLGLCHRAQLFFELDRPANAMTDYEEASASRHPEVKAALASLKALHVDKYQEENLALDCAPYTWRERQLRPDLCGAHLTDLETQVVDILSQRPMSFDDLVEALYGTKIDFESGQNRLKQLLHRIRKKNPSILIKDDEKYAINDCC